MNAIPPPAADQSRPAGDIDPKLIVPFVNSVRDVFHTMLHMQTTVQRPHVKGSEPMTYDVSSIIGFSGEVAGSVVVSFPLETARRLVAVFAEAELEPHDEDFADALGELGNMVAGAAKKDLNVNANISTPSVVFGRNHSVAKLTDVPCLVVPCGCDAGPFAVEISIRKLNAGCEL